MSGSRFALDEPRYSYAEADRIAGMTHGTAKRWLKGYQSRAQDRSVVRRPPVPPAATVERGVSFLELIEVAAISRLRSLGLSLQEVRALVEVAASFFGNDRPLIALEFKVGGREVFVTDPAAGNLVEISGQKRRRAWYEVLNPFLDTVEYGADGIASRWWPMGQGQQVVVDPAYGFGLPVIAGSGVRTETIWEQFTAGTMRDTIAEDFGLRAELVEKAIQFEANRTEHLTPAPL